MLKITVNNDQSFEFAQSKDGISINGQPFDWNILHMLEGQFHILKDNKSYNIEVVKADYSTKSFTVKVNGHIHQLQAKDQFDLLLEKLGMSNGQAIQLKNLKAPMPGLILDIKVSEGQAVKKGDIIMILEAMKMENAIKSPIDGIVKTIKVQKAQSVEKNQILILF
jgi:biotin carboxyl carrier protein